MVTPGISQARAAVRRQVVWGLTLLAALVFGMGGWAMSSRLSGAVVAAGVVVVDSNVKKVQHPTGGVVGKLNVRNGQFVEEGALLLKLDPTVLAANLAIVTKGIAEHLARLARLEAERDGAQQITFDSELRSRPEASAAAVMAGEERLFEFRRNARAGQKSQLHQRIFQIGQEVAGMERQLAARDKEGELLLTELEAVRQLWQSKLIGIQRVTALERDAARNEGERGQLQAQIAQARGRIVEIELQIIQLDQDLRSEGAAQIREVQGKLAELTERKVAAEDQLGRVDIRSPVRGVVHQITVHAEGAVIGAGEVVMLIVPNDDPLAVEVRANPQDIDQIFTGQEVALKFPALNQQETPEVRGRVKFISADLSSDQRSGMSFYTVQVEIDRDGTPGLARQKLVPGMPVEAYLQTGSRTALSYMLKPLTDHMGRAFRER